MSRLRAVEHGRRRAGGRDQRDQRGRPRRTARSSSRHRSSSPATSGGRGAAARPADAGRPGSASGRSGCWPLRGLAAAAVSSLRGPAAPGERSVTARCRRPTRRPAGQVVLGEGAGDRPDLQRAGQRRGHRRPGARGRARGATSSSSTTNSPDGTGELADELAAADAAGARAAPDRARRASARRTSPASAGGSSAATTSWSRWTPTARTSPSSCRGCWRRCDDADLVLGSRWVPGGRWSNWPARRRLLSRGGNTYVRLALGLAAARRHRRVPRVPARARWRASTSTSVASRATASRSTWPGGPCSRATGWSRCRSSSSSGSAASKMSGAIVREALWRVTRCGRRAAASGAAAGRVAGRRRS